jgi:hypothetical protein
MGYAYSRQHKKFEEYKKEDNIEYQSGSDLI